MNSEQFAGANSEHVAALNKSLMEKGIKPPGTEADKSVLRWTEKRNKQFKMQKIMIYVGSGIGVAVIVVLATMFLRRKRPASNLRMY